jgi:SHS2 domain-containing protein
MAGRFEVISHTADIGIVVYGSCLDELMTSAAEGMIDLITDRSRIGSSIVKRIELEAGDGEILLVKWLNELLFLFEVERLLFTSFDITIVGGNRMMAKCCGEEFDPTRHHIKREIKAATYHNLNIVKESGGYSARIIFDI